MTVVLFILGVIAYMAVGAFLSGFFNEGEDLVLVGFLWPVILVMSLLVGFLDLISHVGMYIANTWFK